MSNQIYFAPNNNLYIIVYKIFSKVILMYLQNNYKVDKGNVIIINTFILQIRENEAQRN